MIFKYRIIELLYLFYNNYECITRIVSEVVKITDISYIFNWYRFNSSDEEGFLEISPPYLV